MKKLELKYGLMHFAFHDDGNGIDLITLGSNSHFQDLDKEVIISFLVYVSIAINNLLILVAFVAKNLRHQQM